VEHVVPLPGVEHLKHLGADPVAQGVGTEGAEGDGKTPGERAEDEEQALDEPTRR
jgi:hypothetical protein